MSNSRYLNMAKEIFWDKADRDNRRTHPTNSKVESWLIEKGFSDRNAKAGATIIRPIWAVKGGRKPKE